jgi:hypothetical protein
MNPRARQAHLVPTLVAALLGAAWAVYQVGPAALDPTYTRWALRGDWAMAWLSWSYFRSEPWGLPLGFTDGFLHPVGVTLANADSVPGLGLLLRPLAPLLPRAFQYLGPWLVLCFALQAALGSRIVALFSPSRPHAVLGGVLFALVPILTHRFGHVALCGQWLLVGLLWLHLTPCEERRTARRLLGLALLFVLLSAGVHPYLCAMTLALALALVARLGWAERQVGLVGAAAWSAGLVGGALGVMALLGYFGAPSRAPGFSHYSANLLAFLNPMGLSRFVRWLPVGEGQYEGFGYLGLGVLLLGAVSLGLYRARGRRLGPLPWRSLTPLLAVSVLMALFSLSSRVRLGPWTVLSYQGLYEALLRPVGETFRAPGRFIWPLGYLCVAGAVLLLLHSLRDRPRWATAALAAAVLLEAVELTPPAPGGRLGGSARTFEDPAWARASGHYAHLVLYPPLLSDGAGRGCPTETIFSDEDAAALGHLAYGLGLTINSGHPARLDGARAEAYCQRLEQDVARGELDARSVYVVLPALAERFEAGTGARAVCGNLDGLRVCVSTEGHPAFRELLN